MTAAKPGQRKFTFKPGSAYYTLVLPKLLEDVPEIVDTLREYAVTAEGDLRPFLLRTANSFENLALELARVEAKCADHEGIDDIGREHDNDQ